MKITHFDADYIPSVSKGGGTALGAWASFGNTACASPGPVKLLFASPTIWKDDASFINTVNSRVDYTSNGFYIVTAEFWSPGGAGNWHAKAWTTSSGAPFAITADTMLDSISDIKRLTIGPMWLLAGDYTEFYIYHASGGSLNFSIADIGIVEFG